jgi:LysM repeat protein
MADDSSAFIHSDAPVANAVEIADGNNNWIPDAQNETQVNADIAAGVAAHDHAAADTATAQQLTSDLNGITGNNNVDKLNRATITSERQNYWNASYGLQAEAVAYGAAANAYQPPVVAAPVPAPAAAPVPTPTVSTSPSGGAVASGVGSATTTTPIPNPIGAAAPTTGTTTTTDPTTTARSTGGTTITDPTTSHTTTVSGIGAAAGGGTSIAGSILGSTTTTTLPDHIVPNSTVNVVTDPTKSIAEPASTVAAASSTASTSSSDGAPYYKVKAGDTLTNIAASHNVPLDSLEAANRANVPDPNMIYVNQKIYLPVEGSVPAASTTATSTQTELGNAGSFASASDMVKSAINGGHDTDIASKSFKRP